MNVALKRITPPLYRLLPQEAAVRLQNAWLIGNSEDRILAIDREAATTRRKYPWLFRADRPKLNRAEKIERTAKA